MKNVVNLVAIACDFLFYNIFSYSSSLNERNENLVKDKFSVKKKNSYLFVAPYRNTRECEREKEIRKCY